MRYTLQVFWDEQGKGEIVPLFSLPLTLSFPSIDDMRRDAMKVAKHDDVPTHSFTISSEDGAVERWFQIDGAWRRKDV